jgi:hypothetical protein
VDFADKECLSQKGLFSRELASKLYEKFKKILNAASCDDLKLDGKGFLKSLGTEIIVQEDGVLNMYIKRM